MSIINNLKFQYHLKTLTAGIYELEQECDVDKVEHLIEKNKKNITAIQKYVKENKLNKDLLTEEEELHYLFLINKNEYMSNYYEKNYEQAFHTNYALSLTSLNTFHTAHYLLASLESLNQIKSQYVSLEKWFIYKKKYNNVENEIINRIPLIFDLSIGKHGSLKDTSYNNSRLSLAYLHFLEQNTDISQYLIKEQSQKYGQAKILYKETEEAPMAWLNNNNFSSEFINFVNNTFTPKKKEKIKP
jgi:hypothetical protein